MIATSPRNDFADWLSPMLVKELRQGMRSRTFMTAFFLTQLLMILSVVFNLTAANSDSSGELVGYLGGLFWFLVAVPMLFVMPIRGFGALHSEIKGGTLELVFLTHLSAWRIAAGKWMALMVQTLLLVCAVLPYVLLRYFLGGVNIVDDLQSLLFLFIASAAFTAATVAMSPYESKLLRGLFIVVLIFVLQSLFSMLFSWLAFGRISGGGGVGGWKIYLCVAIYVPAFIGLALEIAASKIAPPAENHAIHKRLISLGVIIVSPLLVAIGIPEIGVTVSGGIFLTAVLVDAISEPIHYVRSIYQTFLRRGAPGRIAMIFLVPGWISGLWFSLAVACLGAVFLAWHSQFDDHALGFLSWFGALIFPAAIIRLLVPGTKQFLGFYIGLQFFFAVLTLLVGMMSGISDQQTTTWLSPIPNCVFLLHLFDQVKPEQIPIQAVWLFISVGASIAILVIRSIAPSRDIRAMLHQNEAAR